MRNIWKNDFNIGMFSIFILMFANYLVFSAIGHYDNNYVKIAARSAVLLLVLFPFVRCKHIHVKWLLFFVLVLCWSAWSIVIVNNYMMINYVYLIFIVAFVYVKNLSLSQLIFNGLIATIIPLAVVVFLLFVGRLDSHLIVIDGRVRITLGFNNPNRAGVAFFSAAVLLFLYLRLNGAPLLKSVVCSIPLMVPVYLVDSRTALYAFLIFVCISKLEWSKLQRVIVPAAIVVFSLFSYFIASQYDNTTLNELLSLRPLLYHNFIASVDWQAILLGSSFQNALVDNSYIVIIYTIGAPLFLISLVIVSVRCSRIENRVTVGFLLTLLLFGITESILIRTGLPIVVIFYCIIFLVCSDQKRGNTKYLSGTSRKV